MWLKPPAVLTGIKTIPSGDLFLFIHPYGTLECLMLLECMGGIFFILLSTEKY